MGKESLNIGQMPWTPRVYSQCIQTFMLGNPYQWHGPIRRHFRVSPPYKSSESAFRQHLNSLEPSEIVSIISFRQNILEQVGQLLPNYEELDVPNFHGLV
ncbi:hypothetical protein NPIL_231081 [Nephila pilipes]|uniref:Uncharacterized protein n=1 Tax=Nephila pilipes TaxID=299642 RepID=A0A8X6UV38_NEPPI|nr:hypothetical protein NPIL_231081 [Nephila pilipes]